MCWLCWWGTAQCPGEDTCALRNHLHTTAGAVLLPGKHIRIKQHPWNGFWVLDQLLQHFYMWWYVMMSWCTLWLHPLHSFSSDQEDFILSVHPVPGLEIATSSDMGKLASRCNYARRCTTITKGNSAQSQPGVKPPSMTCSLREPSQLSLITSLAVHKSSSQHITQGTHTLNV